MLVWVMPHDTYRTLGKLRLKIQAWRKRDPDATAAQMADGLEVSRSRVAQLLGKMGMATRTRRSPGWRESR